MRMPRGFIPAYFLLIVATFGVAILLAQPPAAFRLEEATIAQIESALGERALSCRSLVEQYLARIEAYDKRGPALNAIVLTNAEALKQADDLDRRLQQSGPAG